MNNNLISDSMNEDIRVEVFDQLNEDIKNIWKENEKISGCYFFQTSSFIELLIASNKNTQKKIIVIWIKNELFAIFPLEIKNIYSIKVLQWIGTNESDYCGAFFINQNKYKISKQNFSFIWKTAVKKIKKFDLIFLKNQPEFFTNGRNPFVEYLDNFFSSKNYFVELPSDYSDYTNKLKVNHNNYKRFNRYKKKMLYNYNLEFIKLDAPKNIEIEKIVHEKMKQLDKKKISHFFNKNLINFYINLKNKNPSNFVVNNLLINGELINSSISFIFNKRFYYFITVTYGKKYNNFPVGKIFISYLIKWCIKNNINTFDFGQGDEEYKKFFSNKTNKLFAHVGYCSSKGLLISKLIYLYKFLKFVKIKNFFRKCS